MYEIGEEKKPEVFSGRNFAFAVLLHVLLFGGFYLFAAFHFKPRQTIIPIDLTLVVNENLDGKTDEPPPTHKVEQPKPKPPEPKPKPKPKPKPPEPKPPKIDAKTDALEKTVVKTNVVKKLEKPKKPKKTMEERIREMQAKAKVKNDPKPTKKTPPKEPKLSREEQIRQNAKIAINLLNQPTGDGRTGKKTLTDAEIRRLLDQGYKVGRNEQLATSEEQRCLSLVQMALNAKWDQLNPQIGGEGTVWLSVNFDANGRLVNCRVSRTCGDALSDRAALMVAQAVGRIAGLSPEFVAKFRNEKLSIKYRVQGR